MSREDRQRWEDKHRGASPGEPLASMAWLPVAASDGAIALDLACGHGRHLPPLCSAGYRVVAVDIALTALAEVARRHRAAQVWPLQADLDDWPFAAAAFDLIVQCDFLDRRLFSQLRASLRGGGYLLVDTFCQSSAAQQTGPRNSAFRLAPGELEERFADWEIVEASADGHQAGRTAMLLRKPQI